MNNAAELNLATAHSKTRLLPFVRDLISLTKPRVMSLLLVSTVCPMVLAAEGNVSLAQLLWLLLGGALVTGSASAVNCIFDRDIDALMERTKTRPLATGRMSVGVAATFSFVIGFAGLVVLSLKLNVYAAVAALVGHLFYTIVYTVWLKRTTPQNIVIGGAAGAIPPIVGWVAITGDMNVTAFLLFLVVFLWTPPHFWALALNKNKDYSRAGVPMMPIVAGEEVTHNQMLLYAISLIPVTALLVFSDPNLGLFSFVVMMTLSLVFAYKNLELRALRPDEKAARAEKAWDVFKFSLIYLSLFFACLVLDATIF